MNALNEMWNFHSGLPKIDDESALSISGSNQILWTHLQMADISNVILHCDF